MLRMNRQTSEDKGRISRYGRPGFTLIEVLVVVTVMTVITSIAVPIVVTIVSNAKLHGGVTSLSGLLQNCRMLAIKENRTKTARFTVLSNGPVAYVKNASSEEALERTDPQVQLGAPLTKYETPTGAGAPDALTTEQLTFTAVTTDPSFNSRGLPCAYDAGVCESRGFVYYFRDRRMMGASGWAAVSISPAGRIKRWTWDGNTWH